MFWNAFNSVLYLVAGVGVFMVGIVMFSECLEKNASKGVRKLFKKISNNRWAGVGVGAGTTAIIQSSSATTVMVIGLVNVGILTLYQATAIIMGANIGTTVTGLMVSLSFFDSFKIKYIFMAAAFAGALMKILTKKEKVVKVADLLLSFGILFVGMEIMGAALSGNQDLRGFFENLFKVIDFPLLLVIVGAVFTAVIQSSSAATGIFLTMINGGILTFGSGLYLVLGANIGTCVTAYLASLTANTNAKRAALIHILFNCIGSLIFMTLIWPLEGYIVPAYESIIPNPAWQLALFHVIFNVATTLMLIWFIKPLNKLACFLIKEKPGDTEIMRVSFIDERLLATPSIAIDQAKKEIAGMAEIARDNLKSAFNALANQDMSEKDKILREETRINFLNQSLARYLVKISSSKISYTDEKLIGGFHHVINDVERIGDHAINMMEDAEHMKKNESKFSDAAVGELKNMYSKVDELFGLSLEVFRDRKVAKLKAVAKIEEDIDGMKSSLTDSHIIRLNAGQCTIEGGEYFYSALGDLERVADHLTNVAFTIRSFTGSQKEAFRKIVAESGTKVKK